MDKIRVDIRWSDDEELERARGAVQGLGGDILAEYDGLLQAAVRPDYLDSVVQDSALPCTLPYGMTAAGGLAAAPSTKPVESRVRPSQNLISFARSSAKVAGSAWSAIRLNLDRLEQVDWGIVENHLPGFNDLLEMDTYLIRLATPISAPIRTTLESYGQITSESPTTFRIRLPKASVGLVKGLPYVADIRRYGVLDTITPEMKEFLEGPAVQTPTEQRQFDVLAQSEEDVDEIARVLSQSPVATILVRGRDSLRFEAPAGDSILAALARLPQTRIITPYVQPRLMLDEARQLVGAAIVGTAPPYPTWTGAGEVVAIFDSGVDKRHPHLANAFHHKQVDGDGTQDMVGHGTHVAGIILGRGGTVAGVPPSSPPGPAGIAPDAKLLSYCVTDANGGVDTPTDLGELLQKAVDDGARIINLSWALQKSAEYTIYGESLDRFIRANPEVLVVVAAGNEGKDAGPAKPGYHRPGTIGAPAMAKNVLTVGACRNIRPQYVAKWGATNGSSFPTPPASDEEVTGQPIIPAALSSRGPTLFDSAKPDLLAPGTMVMSTTSSTVATTYYRPHAVSPAPAGYGYLNGTSMATPMVAGAAAVVRQYLREVRGCDHPSAALMKSLLILGTRPILNASANSMINLNGAIPDFDQGFGRIDLQFLLPHAHAPADRRLAFVDIADDSDDALEALLIYPPPPGQHRSQRRYSVTIPQNHTPTALRVALVWTDVPGRGQQNGLSLRVIKPDNKFIYGNETHKWAQNQVTVMLNGQIRDEHNNVLLATVPTPLPGDYKITVLAEATSLRYQGFALAVIGPITSQSLTVLP